MSDAELRRHFERMDQRFDQIDQRFDQIDRRFEEVDKRFDRIEARLDAHEKRFDGIAKRLDGIDERLDGHDERFDQMMAMIAGLFEASETRTNARFEALENQLQRLDRRVEAMDLRFGEQFVGVDDRFRSMHLAVDQFEGRVMGRLDGMGEELGAAREELTRQGGRLTGLEQNTLGLSKRMDGLADDVRMRFRQVGGH